jgi:MutS domain V
MSLAISREEKVHMSISSAPSHASGVLAEYKLRVQDFQARMTALRTRKLWALAVAFGCFILWVGLMLAALHGSGLLMAASVIPFIGAILSLRSFLYSRARAVESARRASFYEQGIDRIEGNWRGQGMAGLDFARADHLYQADLEILGEGSLFELLSTTRSEVGAERLAAFLLDPPTVEEARARQEAVKELRDATGLREEIALLGKYQFQNCEGKRLRDWLSLPAFTVSRIVPAFLLFSGSVSLTLGVCGYAKILPWTQVFPLLVPWLGIQAWIGLWLVRRVRVHLKTLLTMSGNVTVLRQGVGLIERQQFHSAKLRAIAEPLRVENAATCIRKLERLLIAIDRREDLVLYGFSLWLAAGTQLVLATERWRTAHQKEFGDWLDAWAEFEALNALAGYAYEHPQDRLPELIDGEARFDAKDLRHPLLPRDRCVGNEVALNVATAFYVISGSNMAGKSTFLRAIGLNAVLAAAGAPVSAQDARISVFNVCASISITDSLAERKSKFLAEVERLRASIGATEGDRPVLFLIDEILSGTNSRDRRVAAESVITALVAAGAVGALSTHDLALTEIADNPALCGVNVHMQSEDPNEPLAFDYRVKSGILSKTNALAIVKMLGIHIQPSKPDLIFNAK